MGKHKLVNKYAQTCASTGATTTSAPFRSAPLRSASFRSAPLRAVPFRSVPFCFVPFRSKRSHHLPLPSCRSTRSHHPIGPTRSHHPIRPRPPFLEYWFSVFSFASLFSFSLKLSSLCFLCFYHAAFLRSLARNRSRTTDPLSFAVLHPSSLPRL